MGRPKKVTPTNKVAQMIEKFLADHGMNATLSNFQLEAAHLIPKIPKTGCRKDEQVPNLVDVWETFQYLTGHRSSSLSFVPIAPRPAPVQAPPGQASWTPSPLQPQRQPQLQLQPQPQPQHGIPPQQLDHPSKRQKTGASPPAHIIASVQTTPSLTPRAIVKLETDTGDFVKTETGMDAVLIGLHGQQSNHNTSRDLRVKEESPTLFD